MREMIKELRWLVGISESHEDADVWLIEPKADVWYWVRKWPEEDWSQAVVVGPFQVEEAAVRHYTRLMGQFDPTRYGLADLQDNPQRLQWAKDLAKRAVRAAQWEKSRYSIAR